MIFSFSDLEVYPPFPPKTVKQTLHKTYLDSAGRPTISFFYGNLTDRHEGFIYVCYLCSLPLYIAHKNCLFLLGGLQGTILHALTKTIRCWGSFPRILRGWRDWT